VFLGLPVYNGGAFLHAALDSALAQTFGDFRLLIADNASTDDTAEIAQDYAARDSRVIYHRHEKNLGAAPNFNFCLAQATEPYFKWMAHDDLMRPTYLERCVAVLDNDPGAVLCHSRFERIDVHGAPLRAAEGEDGFNDPDPVVRFARAAGLDHGCGSVFGVIRRDVLARTPGIAPFVSSDRTLLAELALYGRFEIVPETLFGWRTHIDQSIWMSRDERVAWFDTESQSKLNAFFTRQWLAQFGAIRRAEVPRSVKARATFASVGWALRYRGRILRDMTGGSGGHKTRRSPDLPDQRP
jgi:glycosyltransferase involved in cell wall biosynthesis